jgi:hypothetical protein
MHGATVEKKKKKKKKKAVIVSFSVAVSLVNYTFRLPLFTINFRGSEAPHYTMTA